ncbi:hypothetical protein GGR50DRAFT_707070 [Xylaria sp. CBS 124048]|nr:hypothetical protein GGR50DRAFT_707070 [Xylaria sp. CBS 124048]
MSEPTVPKPAAYASVSALDAGHITLRDALYVTDVDDDAHSTMPTLCFLVRHPSRDGATVTNLLFDLGMKRDVSTYPPGMRGMVERDVERGLMTISPDCGESLRRGAGGGHEHEGEGQGEGEEDLLTPERDVDFVILSHVHWDHTGTPADFARAVFIVGAGSLHLVANGAAPYNPAREFNADELPLSRTVELPPAYDAAVESVGEFSAYYAGVQTPLPTTTAIGMEALPGSRRGEVPLTWIPFAGFNATIDFFGDGSVYIVDCPGHLYGHVNLLVCTGRGKYVYLGGDCCHDGRILTGERGVAEYVDERGEMRSAHVNTRLARESLKRIRECRASLQREEEEGVEVEVEVVIAHDKGWRERNRHRFWPGVL